MGFKKGSLLCFIVVTDVLLVADIKATREMGKCHPCMSLSFPSLQLYSLIAVGLLRYFIQWNAHWKQEHLPSWGHFVSPCRSWPLPLYWWDFKIKTSFSKPQADVLAWLTLVFRTFFLFWHLCYGLRMRQICKVDFDAILSFSIQRMLVLHSKQNITKSTRARRVNCSFFLTSDFLPNSAWLI